MKSCLATAPLLVAITTASMAQQSSRITAMNPILRTFPVFICIMLLPAPPVRAQQTPPDSASIAYRFVAGQSVAYRVRTRDSVVIWDVTPRNVVRHRTEVVEYRCDSVLAGGDYTMTATLRSYDAQEWFNGKGPVRTTTHPWVGRPVRFVMNSAGRRKALILDEGRDPPSGTSPGGPFQPLMLPYLGPYPGLSTSMYPVRQPLFENVFPPVEWSGTAMRETKGRNDTLGQKTIQVKISEVGNVSYRPVTAKGKPAAPGIATRINGSGSYRVSPWLGHPVCGEYQLIGNIIIYPSDSTAAPITGRHTLGMIFHLDDPATNALVKSIEDKLFAPKKKRRRKS